MNQPSLLRRPCPLSSLPETPATPSPEGRGEPPHASSTAPCVRFTATLQGRESRECSRTGSGSGHAVPKQSALPGRREDAHRPRAGFGHAGTGARCLQWTQSKRSHQLFQHPPGAGYAALAAPVPGRDKGGPRRLLVTRVPGVLRLRPEHSAAVVPAWLPRLLLQRRSTGKGAG